MTGKTPSPLTPTLVAVDNIKNMTDEELRSHLLTCDGKGKSFKALALQELINREVNDAYQHGRYDGQNDGGEDSGMSMMG